MAEISTLHTSYAFEVLTWPPSPSAWPGPDPSRTSSPRSPARRHAPTSSPSTRICRFWGRIGPYVGLDQAAVAGFGGADKRQVQDMVRALLQLDSIPKPDDAADALAIAITPRTASLAATTTYMLGGRPPFTGNITQLIAQKLTQAPPSLSTVCPPQPGRPTLRNALKGRHRRDSSPLHS